MRVSWRACVPLVLGLGAALGFGVAQGGEGLAGAGTVPIESESPAAGHSGSSAPTPSPAPTAPTPRTEGAVAEPAPAAARGPAHAPAGEPAAELLARGQQVYESTCYFCHGYRGDGRTQAAHTLDPPPRDFTHAPALAAPDIARTVAQGRPGTAMAAYAGRLTAAEIEAVAAYVAWRFVRGDGGQARYHSAANGWPDHDRHAEAFPFARGELAADAPAESLTPAQQRGLALFRAACLSCHEGRGAEQLQWSARPASYPRPPGWSPLLPSPAPTPSGGGGGGAGGAGGPGRAADGSGAAGAAVDAVSGASVYRRHEQAPKLTKATPQERRGERLYQAHCAFCHAPDGSGQHWIGRFMEPPARDLHTLDAAARADLPRTIRDGLPGRAMPAWRAVLSPREIEAVAAYVRKAFGPR